MTEDAHYHFDFNGSFTWLLRKKRSLELSRCDYEIEGEQSNTDQHPHTEFQCDMEVVRLLAGGYGPNLIASQRSLSHTEARRHLIVWLIHTTTHTYTTLPQWFIHFHSITDLTS